MDDRRQVERDHFLIFSTYLTLSSSMNWVENSLSFSAVTQSLRVVGGYIEVCVKGFLLKKMMSFPKERQVVSLQALLMMCLVALRHELDYFLLYWIRRLLWRNSLLVPKRLDHSRVLVEQI